MTFETLPNDLKYLEEIEIDNADVQSEHDSCDYKENDYLSDEEISKNYSFVNKKPSIRTYKEQFAKTNILYNKLNPIQQKITVEELKEELYESEDD